LQKHRADSIISSVISIHCTKVTSWWEMYRWLIMCLHFIFILCMLDIYRNIFLQVIQVASNSLTWLLKPGLHSIRIPEILVQRQSWCGLLPFGCSVDHITTTGLKWNFSTFYTLHIFSTSSWKFFQDESLFAVSESSILK